ncbi:MAG: M20 family metallopeptidase [Candidatus Hodarchaeota archaeon]
MTNESRILRLIGDLIAANSENPPGHEEEAAKVLRNHMEAHGFSCLSVGPKKRPNLIFSTEEGVKGDLVMHGHLDTVPAGPPEEWSHPPFASEIENGKLYGRGACDMKGPVSALAEAMILYSEENHKKPLLFLATSDEESGCSGAEEVAASGLLDGVAYGVCAEPTSFNVLVGEKGIFWCRVVARGKAAHGSRPLEGINAINLCTQALQVLTEQLYSYEVDELLGEQTMSIGKIVGGIKVNVVPDFCEALIDMRTVKGQTPESIQSEMRGRLLDAGLSDSVDIEYVHGKPAVITPSESEIVSVGLDAVELITGTRPVPTSATYGTDCSVLQPKVGIINIICGPGSIAQAHQPNEFIPITELIQAVDVYLEIARHFAN